MISASQTGRAMVIPAPGKPIESVEVQRPFLEPGAILMRTCLSEVCGTDVHLCHGRLDGVPYPLVPGHVSAGVIEEMRGEVCDIEGKPFHIGDRITFLDVHETCGHCWHCLVGKNTTRCPSRKVYGITYGLHDGLLGGWCDWVYLKPGVKVIRLPDELTDETFIGGGCGAPTAFHAVQRADISLNDTVLVQGTGPVGLSAIAFARLSGAGTIIAIGAPSHRLELATAMGADHCIDVTSTTPEQRRNAILGWTGGRGADRTIEATGNPAAVPEGMRLTRDAGIYVVVGQYTNCGDVEFNPHLDLNRKHLDVRGCWGSDFSHFYGAIQVMARHQNSFPWHRLASNEYPLDQAARAVDDVANARVPKAVIRVSKG